jgi:hypothetical protein
LRVNFGLSSFRIRLSFRISYSLNSDVEFQFRIRLFLKVAKHQRKEEEFLAKIEEMENRFELKEGKWVREREQLKER